MTVTQSITLGISNDGIPILPPEEKADIHIQEILNHSDKYAVANAPSSHFELLTSLLKTYPSLTPESANLILKTIYITQSQLSSYESKMAPPTDTFPHYIAIEKKQFQIIGSHIGSGGQGTVSEGLFFSNETEYDTDTDSTISPSNPKKFVRKEETDRKLRRKNKDPVFETPIRKKVSPHAKQYFCKERPSTYCNGHKTTVMPYYPNNFTQIEWKAKNDPAHYLLHKLGLALLPLKALHEMTPPHVHRDLKGENIMDTVDYDSIKFIDFDTITPFENENKSIKGTPGYLNPRSFGSTEETLINQRNFHGIQRPCDDMYAFHTMGIKMVLDLCKAYIPSERSDITTKIESLKKLKTIIPDGKLNFSDEELKKIGSEYPFRALFVRPPFFTNVPQKVDILPSKEEAQSLIKDIINETQLPDTEKDILLNCALFFIEQQCALDEERLSASQAHEKLNNFIQA